MRTVTIVLLLGMLACGAGTSGSQPRAPEASELLRTLDWLHGHWLAEIEDERTEEHWMESRGGTLIGMNRTVQRGHGGTATSSRTVHFEYLRIEQRVNGVFYVSKPSNQPVAEFRLTPGDEPLTATFENLARTDFPQRITYRLVGDKLVARAEGRGAQTAEWTFSRMAQGVVAKTRPITAEPSPVGSEEVLIEDGLTLGGFWENGDARTLGFDLEILDQIIREAERTKSDSLLVIKDGRIVIERYFGNPRTPIETMSMTKSIVSIGIGMLIADGKIASLDTPLSTWFPEWKAGKKALVTLRHVLTHTSGLKNRQGAGVLNRQRDRLSFARKSPLAQDPGTTFSYSNEAAQLLSGVVEAAQGEPLDVYLQRRLFAPLGIAAPAWAKDGAGNVQTYYGLPLTARALARIGQVMLQQGNYDGVQIVPKSWVMESTTAAANTPGHGLLWWIRRSRSRVFIPSNKLSLLGTALGNPLRLEGLAGKKYASRADLWLAAGSLLDASAREKFGALARRGKVPVDEQPGPRLGFAADGWLGQQLIVFPGLQLVAVRQHRSPQDRSVDGAYNKKYGFFDLFRRLESSLVSTGPTDP